MYSINKDSVVCGYLVGTIHFALSDVLKIPGVKTIIDKCDSLYLEITPKDATGILGKFKGLTNISSEQQTKHNELCVELFKRKGIDVQLLEYFKSKGISAKSLEKEYSDVVRDAMNSVLAKLIPTEDKLENNKELIETSIKALEKMIEIIPLFNHIWYDSFSKDTGISFVLEENKTTKALIVERDAKFSTNISKILSSDGNNTPLFGIGIMHIVGVTEGLTRLGYEIKKESVGYKSIVVLKPPPQSGKRVSRSQDFVLSNGGYKNIDCNELKMID